jgi:hypothetical protein
VVPEAKQAYCRLKVRPRSERGSHARTGSGLAPAKTVIPLTTRCISDQKLRTYREFKCNLKLR